MSKENTKPGTKVSQAYMSPEEIAKKYPNEGERYQALHDAVINGASAAAIEPLFAIKSIADNIAKTNSTGETVLHLAVNYGNPEVVSLFLKKMTPAAITASDIYGNTALSLAMENRNSAITRLITDELQTRKLEAEKSTVPGKITPTPVGVHTTHNIQGI